MKSRSKLIKSFLISAIAMLSTSIGFSIAWFHNTITIESNTPGSSVSQYYDSSSGDGSKGHPLIISTPKHFYNFAWLTYKGVYTDVTYFQLKNDIDFSSDLSLRNSALPPIGTSEVPFIGYFDGNKKVVRNLWISSNPNDWIAHPTTYNPSQIGTDIGVFGNIEKQYDGEGNMYGGHVMEFYIENLKVSTDVGGRVGLLCGYLDGSMANVGVKNGQLEFRSPSGTKTYKSDYSLIGENAADLNWIDKPGSGGGTGGLRICPNEYTAQNHYTFPLNSGSVPCKDATYVDDKPLATIEAVMDRPTKATKKSSLWLYTGNISFGSSNVYSIGNDAGVVKINSNTDSRIDKEFFSMGTNLYFFKPGGAPSFPNTANAKPTNSIWFKPLASGNCVVSFMAENMNNSGRFSIYRISRNGNGVMTSHSEMKFEFTKNGKATKLSNGDVVYFSFDVEEGYEYCISKDSNNTNTNVGLCFLKLAGTTEGSTGVDDSKKYLLRVDFMEELPADNTSIDNIWHLEYVVHNMIVEIRTDVSNSSLNSYYNALPSDHKVHFFVQTGLTFTVFGDEYVSESSHSSTVFPPIRT